MVIITLRFKVLLNTLDAVVSNLLGHEAHAVGVTGLGELAHFGPLVRIGIIVQHFSEILTITSPLNINIKTC